MTFRVYFLTERGTFWVVPDPNPGYVLGRTGSVHVTVTVHVYPNRNPLEGLPKIQLIRLLITMQFISQVLLVVGSVYEPCIQRYDSPVVT